MRGRIVGIYAKPESTGLWLADVYALNALWCAVSKEQQAHGGTTTTGGASPVSLPKISLKLVADMFEQALYDFARAAHASIRFACYEEIENACDPFLVRPSKLKSWLINEASETIRSGFYLTPEKVTLDDKMTFTYALFPFKSQAGNFFAKIGGWPSIIRIFRAGFWKEEADLYGGVRWATIANESMSLLGEIKRGNPEDVMRALHGVLGLRHNTGFLFTKSSMGLMAVPKLILDRIPAWWSTGNIEEPLSPSVNRLIELVSPVNKLEKRVP